MKFQGFLSRSELRATLGAFRREFMAVGIFSMVINVLMLAPTLYMLQVYDRVLSSRSELTLLAVSLLTLFLFAATSFAEWSRSRLLVRIGVRLDAALGTRVFNAAFESNLSQSGAAAQRGFADLNEVRQFLTGNGVFAFFDAPWAPVYIAVLFVMHPLLGYAAVVFALLQALIAWLGHSKTVQPLQEASKASNEANAYLQAKLRNAEVVESMGMLQSLRRHWLERHEAYMDKHGKAQALSHQVGVVSKFARYCQQSFALGLGGLLVIDGQLTPGAMIASNVLTTRALAPIDMMVGSWRAFIGAREAFGRLEQLLEAYPERDSALHRTPPTGALELEDVSAMAAGRPCPILQGVSLQTKPGTVVVVVGPSGSGKSTLARVMVGIWPEVSGKVALDGSALQGWNRAELGPHIGYLPQDIELFEGSIAENIARFSEVDSPKVIAAAQSAGLHEMILRLPKGYDTPMGEAGSFLSGGQRQRIALARAIYGDPALIVLDEPNANLDEVGEQALNKAVLELKAKGKAVVLITHRPGALAMADHLVLMQDGQIRMQGPRHEVAVRLQQQSTGDVPQAAA